MNPNETIRQPTWWYTSGYAISITFLLLNFFYTLYNLSWTEWSWNAASTSRATVEALDDTLSIIKDAETGQRGYLLTGDEKYLEPYHRAVATAPASLDHLRSLAAGNDTLRSHFDDVAEACSAKLAELGRTVDLRRDQGFEAAVAVVKTDVGKILMDRIRTGLAAMRLAESTTREDLRVRRRTTLRQTLATFTLTSIMALALLFAVHFVSERSRIRSRRHTAWLSTALSSIGDAVISTDAQGAISFMNAVAEELCGWTRAEAMGLPLESVFRIVNEASREVVENPVAKVLANGHIVGLANHTILIARGGTERPIDDSAAPIKNRQGAIEGVILVFRDITERHREDKLKERRARNAALTAAIGLAFSQKRTLPEMLSASTDAIVHHLETAFARIWTLDAESNVLELQTSSGMYTHIDGPHRRVPVGAFKIGRIAEEQKPHLTNDVPHDPHVSDQAWARREGMVAFAGYPLMVEGRLLGVVALFARQPLAADTLDALTLVADVISLGIDRKRSEEVLKTQAAALKAADHRKDEFLAMLAHELRNPLGVISNGVQLVQMSDQPEMFGEISDLIQHQVKHLTRLIDDLLDVSRITQGKITLKKETVELGSIVNLAAELVRPLMLEKRHVLTTSVPEEIRFVADPTRTVQILGNLLTNAAKYSEPEGSIHLAAFVDGDQIVMLVRDNGIGIPPEMLPHVFELFTQVDATLDRSQGGLGIGLTLVHTLVEMHGGQVKARSEGKGKGSEFTVRLPIGHPTAADEVKAPNGQIPTRRAASGRILVVDDNEDTARLTARMLKLQGYEVETAHDGFAAVELARRLQPAVVLLDIGLPGMNGYEVASLLLQEDCCKDARLIAISGYGEEQARQRSQAAGFLHHLTKPLDFAILMELIETNPTNPLDA